MARVATPWHFWIIVALGLVWHLIGAIDYTAVQYDWAPWLSMISERQRGFIEGMPDWIDGAWAISAWLGLAGAILMALKVGFSPLILSLSMFATLVVAIWATVFSDPSVLSLTGWTGLATIWIAVAFTLFLWLYARDLHKAGIVA